MQIRDSIVPLGDGIHVEVRRIRHPDSEAGAASAAPKPTLVFLHESLGSIALWRKFPERLAKATGCDALIYNRLGYGGSSDEELPRPYDYQEREGAVVLPRLLDELGIDRVALIGHSDGGSIALIAAGALGERVVGLITMAAHTYADQLTIDGITEMMDRYQSTDLRDKLHRYHGARTDDLFRAWHTVWLDEGFDASLDFRDWLEAIRCPAMIIQGEVDEYGVPEQVTDIVAGIGPSAQPLFLPDTGHSPHLEKPDQVLELVCDFLLGQSASKSENSY